MDEQAQDSKRVISRLNDPQNKMLDAALAQMREAQEAAQEAEARVQSLIAFACPEGADGFDMETREYTGPNTGPELVED